MTWPHTPPDLAVIEKNKLKQPEGERIRQELTDFLERNKIVSMLLDTEHHTIEVSIDKLPPKFKNVLSVYGAISVVDDSPDENACPQSGVGGWHSEAFFDEGNCIWCGAQGYRTPVRPENWDDNCIPPMTHPLCKYWDQPNVVDIAITTLTASMTKEVFDDLYEYSSTYPSGVYVGKMWKAHTTKGWRLCWYSYSKVGTGYVSNEARDIILLDGELPK